MTQVQALNGGSPTAKPDNKVTPIVIGALAGVALGMFGTYDSSSGVNAPVTIACGVAGALGAYVGVPK